MIGQGHPCFDSLRAGFAERFADADIPAKLAFPTCAEEVAEALTWAREAGLPFRVRSGGHSFEGFSSRVQGGLTIDLRAMDDIRIEPESRTVRAGAGIRMGRLTEALAAVGLGLPLATGRTVGLGGLCLGGGFGLSSRRHGLTCDNLLEAEIVLQDGSIVTADAKHNQDLFWALRGGGGGNFGIVTQFVLAAHPIHRVGMFMIRYPWDDFERVVDAWQHWAPHADPGVTSFMTLTANREIIVQGQYTPEGDDLPNLDGLLEPIVTAAQPLFVCGQAISALEASELAFEAGGGAAHAEKGSQLFKSTSAFAYEPLPIEGIRRIRLALENVPALREPPSQPSMVQLLSGGGRIAAYDPAQTAAFHRRAQFLVQYDGYWTAPQDGPPTCDWVTGLRRSLLPYTRGAYVNYVDSDLGEAWLDAYYGSNVARLRELKRRWDPQNVFRFEQSIPPA